MVQYDGLFLFPELLFEFSEIERVAPQQSRELLNGLQESQPRKIFHKRVYTRTILLQEPERFGAEFDHHGVELRKRFAELGRFGKDLLVPLHDWAHTSYRSKHFRKLFKKPGKIESDLVNGLAY